MRSFWILALAAALSIGWGGRARAFEPFDYWANPQGLYGVVYPVYYQAERFTDKDGRDLITNLGLKQTGGVFRTTYYNKSILPNTIILSAFIPYEKFDLLGQTTSGIGDLTLAGGYFFYDQDQPHKVALGLGFQADLPTGAYDPNRAFNVGADVWSIRPLLSYAGLFGRLDVESVLKYNFSSENPYTLVRPGNKLDFETYVGWFLSQKVMAGGHFNVAASADNKLGGQTVSGSGTQVLQAGGSVQYMPALTYGVLFEVLKDFNTQNLPEGILYLGRFYWKIF